MYWKSEGNLSFTFAFASIDQPIRAKKEYTNIKLLRIDWLIHKSRSKTHISIANPVQALILIVTFTKIFSNFSDK